MFLRQIHGHTLWQPALREPFVVLDFGANVGGFSHAMLQAFDCRIVAAEANPAVCRKIPAHERLTVHNLAIAGAAGTIALHVSSNSEASSILNTPGHDTAHTIDVEAVTVAEFMRRAGVSKADLVKFDIEGAEIEALDACDDALLRSFPQLTIEFHDFTGQTPPATVARVVERLRSLGFHPIKIWRHAWGDSLFVNRALVPAASWQLAWAQHVTRNAWGLGRVVSRTLTGKKG